MHKINLSGDIYFLGVNDRRTALFENFWPLPNGVTYNSYLIVDEKVCLIDTVERKFSDDLFEKIEAIIGKRPVDYLIINHVEPDHSGAIRAVKEKYPGITLVGNKKTIPIVTNFYGDTENSLIVEDGGTLDLGKHELSFHTIPMVHWPESMVTFESETGILFSNDAFGSFGTFGGAVFDDEVDLNLYEEEVMRYYTNIVGKYCPHTQRALVKLENLKINQIAPSHGLLWRSNLSWILERYQKWSSYSTDNGVVIVFGSMYGHTEKMADAIGRQLANRGVKNLRIYDASKTHISYIISDIFKYKGVIIGSCAYNNEMFPPVEALVREIEHKGIKDHYLGLFGSYSWNGGGVKNLEKFAEAVKWEIVDSPVEEKGALKEEKYAALVALANAMAGKLVEDFGK